jgi:hypothetical protein
VRSDRPRSPVGNETNLACDYSDSAEKNEGAVVSTASLEGTQGAGMNQAPSSQSRGTSRVAILDAAGQRRYKREYMRRWRADPRNLERELHTRLRAALSRKVGPRYGERRLYLNRQGEAVCGFCWRRPPVKMQERLRISEGPRNEYVKVLIPCCGEC